MRRVEGLALFLCFLVVMLPIYSADAYAASQIQNVQVTGQDRIPGVVRNPDRRIITADVLVEGDTDVIASQVTADNVPFTFCVPGLSNFFQCTFEDTSAVTTTSGIKNVQIKLKNDNNAVVQTRAGSFVRDDSAPLIESLSIDPLTATTGDVTVTVGVKDIAQLTTGSACAGVSAVKMYVDGEPQAVLPVAQETCSAEHEFVRSASSFGGTGLRNVCFGAVDKFDQETAIDDRRCEEFTFDPVGLQIDTTSMRGLVQGAVKDFIPASFSASGVEFRVNISDPDGDEIQAGDVRADFSGIGGNANKIAASCVDKGDTIFECKWTGVAVSIDAESTFTVEVSASDGAGNIVTASAIPFLVDDVAPQVTGVQSLFVDATGQQFLGKNFNQILVLISESGSGLDATLIDVSSQVFSGHPSECGPAGCLINITTPITASNGAHVRFSFSGTDIAGNALAGAPEVDFIVDKSPPLVLENEDGNGLNVTFTNQLGFNESFFKEGEVMTVVAMVEEKQSTLRALANFSQLGAGESVEGFCVEDFDPFAEEVPEGDAVGSGKFTCVWPDVGPLVADPTVRVNLSFFDSAGNEVSKRFNFAVAEDAGDEEVFWANIEVTKQSPEKISRELIQVAPLPMYVYLRLVPSTSTPQEVKLFATQFCSDERGLVANAQVIQGLSSNEQLLRLDLAPISALDENNQVFEAVDVECTYSVITKRGNAISSAQTLTSNFSIGFFDLPTGVLGQDTQTKIDAIVADVNGPFNQAIVMIKFAIHFLEKLCELYGLLNAIVNALATVSDVLRCFGISTAAFTFGISLSACGAGAGIGGIASQVGGGMKVGYEILQWGCSIASCTVWDRIEGAARGTDANGNPNPDAPTSFDGADFAGLFSSDGVFRGDVISATQEIDQDKVNGRQSSYEPLFSSAPNPACAGEPNCPPLTGHSPNWCVVDRDADGNAIKQCKSMGFMPQLEMYSDQQIRANPILSTVFLCLPGFLDYYIKLRENKCQYAVCLRDQVPTGTPPEFCAKQYLHMNCQAQGGGLIALIPFVGFLSNFGNLGSNIAAPFLSILGGDLGGVTFLGAAGISLLCGALCIECATGCSAGCIACSLFNLVPIVTDIYNTLSPLFNPENDFLRSTFLFSSPACESLVGAPFNIETPTSPFGDPSGTEQAAEDTGGAVPFSETQGAEAPPAEGGTV